MTSVEVCEIMTDVILRRYPECEIITIPIADGGEGTVDCFLKARAGEKVNITVRDAYGGEIEGFYGRFGNEAVIEMAAVAGMVSNMRRDTLEASTYGVGQLIGRAINNGAKTILIGLGGSCTSDAGCGMLCALGMRFFNADGKPFLPVGGTLDQIAKVNRTELDKKLEGIQICCICDTNKVMYGPDGAAYVYAPQKGADEQQVEILDNNLRTLAEFIKKEIGVDVSELPGGGAAGAMGAGAVAFMNAELKPGIEYIMEMVHFDEQLKDADCVITGEGSFDMQSFSGKAVYGVATHASKQGVPVIVITGRNRTGLQSSPELGITAIYETAKSDDFEEIKKTCRSDLAETMEKILL
jgi:glycerate kinase